MASTRAVHATLLHGGVVPNSVRNRDGLMDGDAVAPFGAAGRIHRDERRDEQHLPCVSPPRRATTRQANGSSSAWATSCPDRARAGTSAMSICPEPSTSVQSAVTPSSGCRPVVNAITSTAQDEVLVAPIQALEGGRGGAGIPFVADSDRRLVAARVRPSVPGHVGLLSGQGAHCSRKVVVCKQETEYIRDMQFFGRP